MKLLILITKSKNVEWPGGEAWKVKKALVEKYRPDDVLNVSELKGNQDNLDMFEDLAEIEYAYLETKATLGSQDVIGAVFSAAPEKYHHVLNITADIKGSKLDIDDIETAMYKMWHQGGGKPREMMKRMRLYYRH
jgi:vacuolar-type H+-ATPase subunit C/Vma6